MAQRGAAARRTRGRPQRARHSGKASTPLAGSKPSRLPGTIVGGTRAALRRAWPSAARPARGTAWPRP